MVDHLIIVALAIICVLLIVDRVIHKNDRRLSSMAKIDPLTGLSNRKGFHEVLAKAFSASRGKPFYLFIFDVDDFQHINDVYGHLVGDEIISRIGKLAQQSFPSGVVARWGADEFAGFYAAEREHVLTLVNDFYERVRMDEDLQRYGVTVCFGITECKAGDSVNALLYRADRALSQAKDSGKDRYEMIE